MELSDRSGPNVLGARFGWDVSARKLEPKSQVQHSTQARRQRGCRLLVVHAGSNDVDFVIRDRRDRARLNPRPRRLSPAKPVVHPGADQILGKRERV